MTSTDFLQKESVRKVERFESVWGTWPWTEQSIQMSEGHACVPSVQGTKESGCIAFRAREEEREREKEEEGGGWGRGGGRVWTESNQDVSIA